MGDVTAQALQAELDAGKELVLLDVRQSWEHASGHLPGAILIPLPGLPFRLRELDSSANIVLYCRSGHRAALACGLLRRAGFPHVRNLRGGYLAWAASHKTGN